MSSAPILVIGVHGAIAITTARSLARRGIPVVGISHGKRGVGLWSKTVTKGYHVPYAADDRAAYCERVIEIYHHHGARGILCHHERQMLDLNDHVARTGADVKLLFPERAVLDRVLDKPSFMETADKLGVRIPRTTTIARPQDVAPAAAEFPFPAVMKVAEISDVSLPAKWQFKCQYFESAEEFAQFAADFSAEFPPFLLQEYVTGTYESIGLAVQNGRAVAAFQWTAEREYEPGLGGFRRSLPLNRDLVDIGVALYDAVGFEGVGEVEFRHNLATGELVLMEINPRLWGGCSLPVACGVDFPAIAMDIYSGTPVQPSFNYALNVWSRNTYGDLKWFLKGALRNAYADAMPNIRRERREVVREFVRSIGRARVHDLDSLSDPAPTVRHVLGKLKIRV